jgi:hypothetical protein
VTALPPVIATALSVAGVRRTVRCRDAVALGSEDGPEVVLPHVGWSVGLHRLSGLAAVRGRPIRRAVE